MILYVDGQLRSVTVSSAVAVNTPLIMGQDDSDNGINSTNLG